MIFKSSVDKTRELVTITCPKRIDVNVSDELRSLISEIIDGGKFRIVLNLKSTEYIDSSGLGAIVARLSVLRSNDGDIRFAEPGTSVLNLLEITHLNKILKIFDSLDLAIDSFKSE